jgi:hypothetical protein
VRELSEIGAGALISLNPVFFKGWVGGEKDVWIALWQQNAAIDSN